MNADSLPDSGGDRIVALPDRPIHVNGRQYMTDFFNGSGRSNSKGGWVWLMQPDGIAYPVAGVNGVNSHDWPEGQNFFERPEVRALIPKTEKGQGVIFAWSDLNNDHHMQADECKFRVVTEAFEEEAMPACL